MEFLIIIDHYKSRK